MECVFCPCEGDTWRGGNRVSNRVLLSSSHIIHRHVFYKVFIPLMVFFNGQWKKKWSTSECERSLWCLEPNKVPKDRRDTTQWCPNFHFFFPPCVCFEHSRTERRGTCRGCVPVFSFVIFQIFPGMPLFLVKQYSQCELLQAYNKRDLLLWKSNFLNQSLIIKKWRNTKGTFSMITAFWSYWLLWPIIATKSKLLTLNSLWTYLQISVGSS